MNEIVTTNFDYSVLDAETANFLRQKEINIRGIASKTFSEIGAELKEAQDRLAKHRHGCFEEWYTILGLKKQTVYNYISYHNLIVQQLDNREMIEALPKPLAYEIAKPTIPEEIKQKVLSGDIITTRELQEAIKAQKEAERKARELEQQLAEAQNREPETIIKEVVPEEVQRQLSEAQMKAREIDKVKAENKKLRFELEAAKSNPVDDRMELEAKVSTFTGRIKGFLVQMAPLGYMGQEVMRTSPQAQREYETAIEALEKWCQDMRDAMIKPRETKIIDVEVIQ